MSKFILALKLQRWSASSHGTNVSIEVPPEVANSADRRFWPGSASALMNSMAECRAQRAVSSAELEEPDSIRHRKEGAR
jgi:hypothetical protein